MVVSIFLGGGGKHPNTPTPPIDATDNVGLQRNTGEWVETLFL